MSLIPAATGIFRDMTGVRFEHPQWIPQNCTACGACYTVCPDSAIPGLVHPVLSIFETVNQTLTEGGRSVKHLQRAIRTLDQKLRFRLQAASDGADEHRRPSVHFRFHRPGFRHGAVRQSDAGQAGSS